MSFLKGTEDHVMWAPVVAFSCILAMLAILLSLPFLITRMRRVPRLNSMLNKLAVLLGAPQDEPQSHYTVKKPLSKDVLRTLHMTHYKPKPGDAEDPNSGPDCCPICFGEYSEGRSIITLCCGHFFHTECITKWLKRDATCPMCKADLQASNTSSACSSRAHSSPHAVSSSSGSSSSGGAGGSSNNSSSVAAGAAVTYGVPVVAPSTPAAAAATDAEYPGAGASTGGDGVVVVQQVAVQQVAVQQPQSNSAV